VLLACDRPVRSLPGFKLSNQGVIELLVPPAVMTDTGALPLEGTRTVSTRFSPPTPNTSTPSLELTPLSSTVAAPNWTVIAPSMNPVPRSADDCPGMTEDTSGKD